MGKFELRFLMARFALLRPNYPAIADCLNKLEQSCQNDSCSLNSLFRKVIRLCLGYLSDHNSSAKAKAKVIPAPPGEAIS